MNRTVDAARIAANLARLQADIDAAAATAGRRPQDIQLIAACKNQPPQALAAALAVGQHRFGENTVQDAMTRLPHFAGQDVEWHFIGHLQSNKARQIPGRFAWLHSLDSLRLAERVARFARAAGTEVNALVEINITRDPARHGIAPEQLEPLLNDLLMADLGGLRLRGLMTVGPHPASEAGRRQAFASLRRLGENARQQLALPAFSELSMGMSEDYREAILEGATFLRIGTAIFGVHNHNEA